VNTKEPTEENKPSIPQAQNLLLVGAGKAGTNMGIEMLEMF
jgi:hypothetical protein